LVASIALKLLNGVALGVALLLGRDLVASVPAAGAVRSGILAVAPQLAAVIGIVVLLGVVTAAGREVREVLSETTARHAKERIIEVSTVVELSAYETPSFHNRLSRAATGEHRPIQLVDGLMGAIAIVAVPMSGVREPATASQTPSVPPHGEREPAGTRIERIGGTGVVFQYGQVVPSFDGWRHHEPTREYRGLDGQWRFRFDPYDEGLTAGWHLPGTDTSGWDAITVPSAWDLKDNPTPWGSYDGSRFGTGTAFYDGYAWYRTSTRIPGTWTEDEVRLTFLAVNYRADVWVNGRFAGAHEGGYTPFGLPVGHLLRPGQDATIVVRVHRRADLTDYTTGSGPVTDPLAVPYKPTDWWPYAGIPRSVWLEAVPQVNIPKVLVAAQDGRLDARVVVANQTSRPFSGQVLPDPGEGSGGEPVRVPVAVDAGEVAVARAVVPIPGAPTWSPDSPQLLTATAQLRPQHSKQPPVDQLSTTYGVRTVDVDGPTLTVNGRPAFLKGLEPLGNRPGHQYDREVWVLDRPGSRHRIEDDRRLQRDRSEPDRR
jgi:beta-glucuronidase